MSDCVKNEKQDLAGASVVNAGRWLDENISGPFFNGLVAENPLVQIPYKTIAKVVNEDVLHRQALGEIKPSAEANPESLIGMFSGGLAMLYSYSMANCLAGKVLRGMGSALKAEGMVAKTLSNERVAHAVSGLTYGALQDLHPGDTRTSKMCGSLGASMLGGYAGRFLGQLPLPDRVAIMLFTGNGMREADDLLSRWTRFLPSV